MLLSDLTHTFSSWCLPSPAAASLPTSQHDSSLIQKAAILLNAHICCAVVVVEVVALLATLCNVLKKERQCMQKVDTWQVMQSISCQTIEAVCRFTLSVCQLNMHCTRQMVGTLHDYRSPSGPCVCVNSGEHGDDEVEAGVAEHKSEEDDEEDDGDAVQQDRRASHAKASTRNADEQMPDAAHDAGVFACSACCNMLHLLGMSEHALILVHQDKVGMQQAVHLQAASTHALPAAFPLHSDAQESTHALTIAHALAWHPHNQLNHQLH